MNRRFNALLEQVPTAAPAEQHTRVDAHLARRPRGSGISVKVDDGRLTLEAPGHGRRQKLLLAAILAVPNLIIFSLAPAHPLVIGYTVLTASLLVGLVLQAGESFTLVLGRYDGSLERRYWFWKWRRTFPVSDLGAAVEPPVWTFSLLTGIARTVGQLALRYGGRKSAVLAGYPETDVEWARELIDAWVEDGPG